MVFIGLQDMWILTLLRGVDILQLFTILALVWPTLTIILGWFSNTEVRSNACGPNVNIPVWIGEVKYWVFYVFYDPYKRENNI